MKIRSPELRKNGTAIKSTIERELGNSSDDDSKESKANASASAWKTTVRQFQKPAALRANWQLTNSIGSYAALWLLMHLSLGVSVWLTLGLATLAAGFLVRIFIIFHDCAHGSFFASKRANVAVGRIAGILTFTPFEYWRREHTLHHATSGDLDRRGTGDVATMTVEEYLDAPFWIRVRYRLARHPLTLLIVAPLFLFLLMQRFSSSTAGKLERRSVLCTNLGLLLMSGGLAWLFGWQSYLLIQLTILALSGAAGVWLFYVQHQFEGTYWERNDEWDFASAALQGSSFYQLPRILQWFSGNIGYHHIHHLSSRIPNYRLEACHRSHPLFHAVKPMNFRASLRAFNLRLWDEESRRLVSFKQLKTLTR